MSANNGYIGRAPSDSSVIVARQTFNPTGGQTTFTFNSNYDVGYLDAYLNGARLINASDYTAADGSSVVLGVGATTGDVLECVAYKAFNLGSSVVGVSSGGTVIKADDVRTLNFIGAGNTFAVSGNTVDISISGGGAGGKWQTDDTNTPAGISTSTNVSIGVTLATSALTVTGDAKVTGVVTATSFYGDGINLSNTISGVGVNSGGTNIGYGVTTLNFVGSGTTIEVSGTTANISAGAAGGAGVSSTGILTCRGIANADDITESVTLDDFYGDGTNYAMVGPITVVGGGTTVTVGSGVSYVIV